MKTKRYLYMLLVTGLILLLQGCTDEETTPVNTDRENFVGTWNVSPGKKVSGEATIYIDELTTNGVNIKNFALIGDNFPMTKATVSGTIITLVPDQVIGTGITVNGSGVLSGNKITWNYTTFDGADLTTVKEIYTKK